uniref:Uncharacterized protein n=1 Tax=Ralstonia syzygii R24 TaxID=907261 RepID=G3ACM5_9RALS|nr:hypothetical protein RALSY_mp30647 [Ralstonia syzygii R24]
MEAGSYAPPCWRTDDAVLTATTMPRRCATRAVEAARASGLPRHRLGPIVQKHAKAVCRTPSRKGYMAHVTIAGHRIRTRRIAPAKNVPR